MKRVVVLAETASRPLVMLVALAHALFLAAFLATLVMLAGEARAETAACTGVNLIPAMERDAPDKVAAMRAEAAKVVNGNGLLWRIEKEGVEPSFLFGTMHMTDPRVVTLPADAQRAFDAASTVVIETTDVLDQSKMMAVMVEAPQLMMFTDATTLGSLLDPADAAAVKAALQERGIPLASVNKMKPWVLSAMVALPACELSRKAAGAPVLDVNLANEAKNAGKTVDGLETARSQLEAMASLPLEFHVKGLVETLKLGDKIDDVIETMLQIYLSGETGLFVPFFGAVTPESGSGSGYADFERAMITARNATMAKEAEAFIDRGGAFIAVGALHLPGEKGVIEELRRSGYAVSPAT